MYEHIEVLRAQVAELQALLRPFAALADGNTSGEPDARPVRVLMIPDMPNPEVIASLAPHLPTLGHCRHAAAVLKQI